MQWKNSAKRNNVAIGPGQRDVFGSELKMSLFERVESPREIF